MDPVLVVPVIVILIIIIIAVVIFFKKSNKQFVDVVVGKVSDFKDGEIKECTLRADNKVLVIKDGNKFSAVGTKCTHLNIPLKTGVYYKGRLRCPAHGACFSVNTGDIEDFPGLNSIACYNVRVNGQDVIVRANPSQNMESAPRTMCKRLKSDTRTFIIIGGGAAGGTAAETLRAEGFTGRIIVINREKHLPYDRPKLSKVMNIALDKVQMRDANFYSKADIEFLLGITVNELDSENKSVTLSDGKTLKYDQCLVASGAEPQRLPFIPGYDALNIYALRTIEDAHTIYDKVEGKNVLICGSSFIGMETASCIVKKAKQVIVVGMENVPFERVLGTELGHIMQQYHEHNGVKFIMNAVCQEFKTNAGQCTSVLLKSGEVLDNIEVVIVGAGVIPATNFIKESPNIKKGRDKSIEVDKYLRTGAEGLWCAGDLARYPFPMLGGELVRIEHWGMAQIQGAIAAKNMIAGPKHSVDNIPFFWTVQYGRTIRYAGHALRYEDVIIDSERQNIDFTNPKFVAYYIQDGNVLAACSMNRDPVVAQVAELMQNGISISAEELKSSIHDMGTADPVILSKFRK